MTEMRLLPAYVDSPPQLETARATAGIVLSARGLNSLPGDFSRDDYIWTASAGDDGTYHFYAIPRQSPNSGNASNNSEGSDYSPLGGLGAAWFGMSDLTPRYAAAQYQYWGYTPIAASSHLIDVYA